DWQPRHRGKENLCFGDGHVERLKAAQYNGVEPGRAATPVNWPNWGIEN
ncbi:MAG: hypothetical protein JO317_03030, partial [Verrucomicrobiae bacterium]|nr:hypothetical protein [Verrucomicrobiae bacterium]